MLVLNQDRPVSNQINRFQSNVVQENSNLKSNRKSEINISLSANQNSIIRNNIELGEKNDFNNSPHIRFDPNYKINQLLGSTVWQNISQLKNVSLLQQPDLSKEEVISLKSALIKLGFCRYVWNKILCCSEKNKKTDRILEIAKGKMDIKLFLNKII